MKTRPRFVIAAFAVSVLLSPCAYAGIIFDGFIWHIDKGGLAQADHDTFIVLQDDFGGVGPVFHLEEVTLGGASFSSTISITDDVTTTNHGLSVVLTSTLSIFASVDQGWPQGAAQAYASITILTASFTITGDLPYLYAGTEPLIDADGVRHMSGAILAPGQYEFFDFDLAFLITSVLGEGQSETATLEFSHAFAFAVIPSPGALPALVLALIISRRRR